MIISKTAIPRRTVLRGMGSMLALPLLDSMAPALSAMQKTAAKPINRFGVMYVPNGMIMQNWAPIGEGAAFEFNTTTQAPVPEHAPVQPVKLDPTAGFAPSDTAVPSSKDAVHTVPQLMPGGFEVTVPFPESVTFMVWTAGPPLPLPVPGPVTVPPPPHAASSARHIAAAASRSLREASSSFIVEILVSFGSGYALLFTVTTARRLRSRSAACVATRAIEA